MFEYDRAGSEFPPREREKALSDLTIEPMPIPVKAAASELAAHGGILTVDLGALAANYRQLGKLAPESEIAGVVKARAYGLGLEPVARTLATSGCRTFFVAEAAEGRALRTLLPDASIYVLNGLLAGAGAAYVAHGLRPCLSSLAEIEEWAHQSKAAGTPLPAALHFDTGINRLGLTRDETDRLLSGGPLLAGIEVTLVMSHLACADEPDHPLNARQLERFKAIRAAFPRVPASLSNSAGALLGPEYHFDLIRPGIGLYGGNPLIGAENPFRRVVGLQARVLQVRDVARGEAVGYGAEFEARRPSRLAVVSAGYGDGYFRALGTRRQGGDSEAGRAYIAGNHVPLAGRVSMDLLSIDVSELGPGAVRRGDLVELIGPHVSLEDVAARAGTIAYEVLTSLGERYKRLYTGLDYSTSESHDLP